MPSEEFDGIQFGRDDDLNAVVGQLNEGDEVLINDRSLPLTVIDTDSERVGSDPHETKTAYLEGRGGRVYRLLGEYGHKQDFGREGTPPSLSIRKEESWEWVESSVWEIRLDEGQQIMSDTRAGEWLAEAGIDVR